MSNLYIYTPIPELRALLKKQLTKHRYADSGFDIPMMERIMRDGEKTVKFNLGIYVACMDHYYANPQPCLLLPRSSIYKTPYRMCNSIGLIDSGYRGEVSAVTDNINTYQNTENIPEGTRLFQLCSHNFLPWTHIYIVDTMEELPKAKDNRGEGGFGSTG